MSGLSGLLTIGSSLLFVLAFASLGIGACADVPPRTLSNPPLKPPPVSIEFPTGRGVLFCGPNTVYLNVTSAEVISPELTNIEHENRQVSFDTSACDLAGFKPTSLENPRALTPPTGFPPGSGVVTCSPNWLYRNCASVEVVGPGMTAIVHENGRLTYHPDACDISGF